MNFVVMMLNLAGYQARDQIYAGKRTLVYRAIQESDRRQVVIKVLRNPFPHFNDLVRFRNQYVITQHLEHPSIVRPVALERYGNGYALVMPDEGAIALSKYWPNSDQNLINFFNIAIQLAEALHYLSQQRIIHKDIKPSNILIHPQTLQVQLLDFSISSLLPKEQQQLINPNVLEGTLAYMSPEQTGRMNRGIDYRSDFYSLGITCFQLLTRELPFATKDPMELLHSHLVQKVKFPVDKWQRKVPEALQAIIIKLMAKNAEERYQSALGLKHDLEKCLYQWKATKTIIPFELGERDVCDRFLIPEKLYGREREVKTLLHAFEQVARNSNKGVSSSELLLVAGFSGIGKTAVVNEVHKPIVEKRGYFIKGKFDQFNRNIPFSAFVEAFRDLMRQLLSESDAELQSWKSKIMTAVGESGQVIIDVIPELQQIIGEQPAAVELSGTAAQNRFNLLLQKFTQVFSTPEHPLVIFLDDLQWVDSASLNLMNLVMTDVERGYLLLIGAYRDNEVSPTHPLMLALDGLTKAGAILNTITLQPLSQNSLNHLVADTLHCGEEFAQPITDLVHQKTQGNPFFATQFLKVLHEDGLIEFDRQAGHWQCDIVRVQDAALTNDVVEFMALQLQKLPISTQEILKLAACIGNQFDLETLAIVSERLDIETATALWSALQQGLVLPQSQIYKFYVGREEQKLEPESQMLHYRFLHDRMQQAAYSLIPNNEQKQTTHLKIGRLLLKNTPQEVQDEKIFAIVNQLNYGVDLLGTQSERERLAQLNLTAGGKALASTAYHAAVEYFRVGRKLLPQNSWKSHYSLTLALYESEIEGDYLNGDFEEMEQLAKVLDVHTANILDRIKVDEVKIKAYSAQKKLKEATNIGLAVLEQLGVSFPTPVTPANIQEAFQEIAPKLNGIDIDRLIDLPGITEPEKLAAMQILSNIFIPVYIVAPNLLPLVVCKQVLISIDYGNSPESAVAYTNYGLILCGIVGDIETGYQFGKLGLSVLSKLNANQLKSKIFNVAYSCVIHWKEPLRAILKPLQESYANGIETGDLEFASYAAFAYCYVSFLVGNNLGEVSADMEKYYHALQKIKQETSLNYIAIFWQSVLNLQNESKNRSYLKGEVYDEEEKLLQHQISNDTTAIGYLYFNKLILCYLFGEFARSLKNAAEFEKYSEGQTGIAVIPIFYFYDSLTRLALCKETKVGTEERESLWQRVATNHEKMKHWAHHAPMNHQHKVDLVEAEKSRILGQNYQAGDFYDRAISGAKENKYFQEEALANELAAKFYLDWGKEKVAAGYLQEAYYGYANWGAKAKTNELEQCYPHLLQPILEQVAPNNPLETLANLATHSTFSLSNSMTDKSSSNLNTTLDLAAILKASQSISSIIQLDELLYHLTKIILQNSGADSCALILPNSQGKWQVEAITTLKTTELCTQPLEGNPNLPIKLIQYVKNTQEIVIIDSLKMDLPVMDEYLSQKSPQSILCLPLLNQRQLIGILYLQNQLASDVFTSDRLLIINFLCSQAAISLEKARLYKQSQAYAQQLEVSLKKLQDSETRFRYLTANIPGMIYQLLIATDGSTKVFYASSGCFDIYEVSAEEMMAGKYSLRDFEHPEDRSLVDQMLANLSQILQFNLEFRIVTPSGIVKWIQVVAHPIQRADDSIVWDGLIMDVSERKQIEAEREKLLIELAKVNRELEQANEELGNYSQTLEQKVEERSAELKAAQQRIMSQEKLASLGTLTAGVAHELRNPLNFVKNYAEGSVELSQELLETLEPVLSILDPETLELTQSIIDDLQENATTISHHSVRATQIIETMMQHTRVEHKQSIPQATNLHDLLDQAIKLVSHSKKEQDKPFNPSIRTNYAANLDLIKVIPSSFIRALINLMDNAFDAMRSKQNQLRANSPLGTIDYSPTLWVSTQILDQQVEIRIRDNGCGIELGIESKILDPFFTTKPPGEGTGLGLSLTHDIIVKQHQGSINIDSKPGEFTEVIVRLPN
ncbi:MAG: AAA family ATPase [Cyanobacteria bacterium P01_H01_bin.35]